MVVYTVCTVGMGNGKAMLPAELPTTVALYNESLRNHAENIKKVHTDIKCNSNMHTMQAYIS